MRILLTGSTGFLGNNILRMLVDDGHEVRVTVRSSSNRRALDGLDVEKVECNLLEPSEIGPIVSNVDVVIHAAALIQIGWTKLDQSRKVNVESTRKLAQAARLHKAKMIYVSSVDTLAAGTVPNRWGSENDREPQKSKCSYVDQ